MSHIRSLDLNGKPGTDLPLTDVPYQYWASNVNFWKWLIIVGAIVFFIMLLITIGLRKRIKGTVSIIFSSPKITFSDHNEESNFLIKNIET